MADDNADPVIAQIKVEEVHGFSRQLEYVEVHLQLPMATQEISSLQFYALDEQSGKRIPCQVIRQQSYEQEEVLLLNLIFPVTIHENDQVIYTIRSQQSSNVLQTNLLVLGEGLDLVIENDFYKADLTQSDESEAKSHHSGQLTELLIKMGYDIRLFRTENRMHWAPNFQKRENEYYDTIAGWDYPEHYQTFSGPYTVITERRDLAKNHAEIELTANYTFYSGLPYFRFYGSMEFIQDAWIKLLRNDEMTMDSLFTHVAAERSNGEILDLTFSERDEVLHESPIENEAHWLCFYNANEEYAFGSIRLKFDNTNTQGFKSPTYLPSTKISSGANGGKYWNRILINDFTTFVPEGSRYIEENAYIVFRLDPKDKFKNIKYWANRLINPLRVSLLPQENQ